MEPIFRPTNPFVSGLIVMGYLVAGTFFLRFWKDTRDRLFLLFGVAFYILAVQRLGFEITGESETPHFLSELFFLRLAAFALFLLAIIDKNRGRKR